MQLTERTKNIIKAKFKAYAIHLFLSLLIFFIILYILLNDWYPGPFFTAHGGWHGVKILFFVDLVLGPLLTLMIYNCYKSKRERIFDLSIVALIQIVALVMGSMAIYSKKPAALVFWEDRFYTVSMDYYQAMNVSQQQLNAFSENRPPIIFAKKPVDIEAFREMATLTREKQIPAFAQISLYETIEPNMNTVLNYSYDYDGLLERNQDRFQEIGLLREQDKSDVYGTYLMSKHRNMFLLLTSEGDLAGYLVGENINSE